MSGRERVKTILGRSLFRYLPTDFHGVSLPIAVVSDSEGADFYGLSDEQPVKRVAVVLGKLQEAAKVRRLDREESKAVITRKRRRELLDFTFEGKFADRALYGDLPQAHNAKKDFVFA